MAPRGNNMIPNGHFHKKWANYVNTWFNQPFRKERHRMKRVKKARKLLPKPINGPLRSIVHCPSFRYNNKVRLGRGFTINELRQAKMCPAFAMSIGIAVDYRRQNKSVEAMQRNVQRLKEYRSRLILFPFRKKAAKFDRRMLRQIDLNNVFGIKKPTKKSQMQMITPAMKRFQTFQFLQAARLEAKVTRAKNKKSLQFNKDELEK